MSRIIPSAPSALYRQQVANISARMRGLAARMVLRPLRNMAAFNKVKDRFAKIEDEAYLCSSVMDSSRSIEGEERATNATCELMTTLVDLKNEACDLVKNEPDWTKESRQNQALPEIIAALNAIKSQYTQLIANDPILKNDLEQLTQCSIASRSSAAGSCEKIINHLIAEVKEGAEDDQRMADESPTSGSDHSSACRHLQKHLELARALEDFHATYL